MNWYETRTLKPKPPFFISSVDSGNLVASLWTLQQGCLDRLASAPCFTGGLAEGLLDHLRVLVKLRALPKRVLARCEEEFEDEDWLTAVLNFPEEVLDAKKSRSTVRLSIPKLPGSANKRACASRASATLVRAYVPWMLPEFAALREKLASGASSVDEVPLQQLPDLISELEARLDDTVQSVRNGQGQLCERLRLLLPEARQNALRLIEDLRQDQRTGKRPGQCHGL